LNRPLAVGDKIFVKPVGNNARGGNSKVEEWEVKVVGRKYITAGRPEETVRWSVKFYRWDAPDFPLRQVTEYSPDWQVYYDLQHIMDEQEYATLLREIRSAISPGGGYSKPSLTLKQLRCIKHIIDVGDSFYLS
jgi:hypothetical protein